MVLLDSKLSILDETDSGLDIDALKIVSDGINTFMNEDKAIILIRNCNYNCTIATRTTKYCYFD